MSNTTLGLARSRATEEELDATQTVFGRFLLALRAYTTTEQSLTGGTVVWTDESPDHVVLAGMSVLLRSFASQAGLEMRTALRAREVAERLNRRLSAGILLTYESPEAAARAFYTKVILRLRRAHELGYRPGMSLGLSAWSALAADQEDVFVRALPKNHAPSIAADLTEYYASLATIFFAPLLKSARELKERLKAATKRMHKLNRLGEHEIVLSESAQYAGFAASSVLAYLDETQRGAPKVPEGLLTVEQQVAQAIAWCEVMDAFEVKPDTWPQAAGFVDQEWLCSQILLSFTGESDNADIIPDLGTYQMGLRAVLAASDDEVADAASQRLKKRLTRRSLTDAQWSLLKKQVLRVLKRIRNWNPDAVDDKMLSGVVIKVSDEDFLLDPETALQVALGQEDALLGHVQEQGMDVQNWLTGVGFAILWPTLEVEEALAIVKAEVLPDQIIVDNLSSCEDEVREAVISALMKRKVSSNTLNLILMLDLIQVTPDLLREHVEVIEPEIIGANLVSLLEFAVTPQGETIWPALIKALIRAPDEPTFALLRDSIHRVEFCSIGVELFKDVEVGWGWFDRLREKLGDELYRMCLLGSVASDRQMIREDRSEDGGEVDAWEKVFQGGDVSLPIRLLGPSATQETATNLLREVTESDALAWAGLTS